MPSETKASKADEEAALAEAVDLPLDRKREILAREAALGDDHYAVLGLKPGATVREVSAAYHEASRVFHPDRYFGKQLGSYTARLERVFRRLAEAHGTLSDDAKRDAYLKANPRLRVAVAAADAAAGRPPPPTRPPANRSAALGWRATRTSRAASRPRGWWKKPRPS